MNVEQLLRNAKDRWVAAGYPNYSPWVPIVFHGFTVAAAVAAVIQRVPDGHGLPAAGLVAVSMVPYFGSEAIGPRLPWLAFAIASLGTLGVLMWVYPVDLDFCLFVAAMLVGRFGACESMRRSAVVLAMAVAVQVAVGALGGVDGTAFSVAVLLVGWDIGWLLQSQQRRIDQQELEQAEREAKATLLERQRIAREVHDVVAHSLSVTLLHLTAARRDLEDGGDIGEAIAALRDAETVGRQAMTDIRQTVGLLGQEAGTITAAPDLGDLPALVEQFRGAGLDIQYAATGDLGRITAGAGTGLYRIAQESLANIAKHEPQARAAVLLDLSSNPARLVLRNTLTHPVTAAPDGRGLRGMSERATSLDATFSAGPDGDAWQVVVELANPGGKWCPIPRLLDLRRTTPETA